MSIHLTVTLSETAADLLTGYGAGAKLYLDSSATETGVYANVTSSVIVSGTEVYEFWDSAGTSSTWYKSRVGASDGSSYGAYSDAFQATSVDAYASLMDLRESMDLPDTSRDAYLLDLLRVASEHIDSACGRQFYRDPQVSGDGTFYVDIERADRDHLVGASYGYTTTGEALDIVSITTLSMRPSESEAYVEIAAGDAGYYLDHGDAPWFPYGNVSLSPAGTYTTFSTGRRAVKIVGVLGFASVPQAVRNACLDMAREAYRQGPGGGPAQVGTNQFGAPVFLTGFPVSFRQLIGVGSPYLRRSYVHV
ncbi:MAG TPA: hypothetical protein VMW94_03930 [Actinomycetes bacterium]|nr:hypothetical protein [Actinomycetes bacterium]